MLADVFYSKKHVQRHKDGNIPYQRIGVYQNKIILRKQRLEPSAKNTTPQSDDTVLPFL